MRLLDVPVSGLRWLQTRGNHFLGNKLKKVRAARRNGDDDRHRSPDAGFRCARRTPRGAPRFGGTAATLAVATLVYVGELEPRVAIATAFMVVAAGAVGALAGHALRGRVRVGAGARVAAAAGVAAFVGGAAARFVPDRVLLGSLSATMIAVAAVLVWRAGRRAEPGASGSREWLSSLAGAAGAGVVAGALGFAGGHSYASMLPPSSTRSPAEALATSSLPLLVTALGGLAGYATHDLPYVSLGILMSAAAAVGAFVQAVATTPGRGRASTYALSVALLVLGLIVFAREILPATIFPDL